MGNSMLGETVFKRGSIPVLTKSLDASMLRQRAIANNIANVNTPGYQRIEVTFEDELRKALDKTKIRGLRTDAQHLELGKRNIASLQPKVEKPLDPALASGVNNVDIDLEMAKLAENQILYNFSAKFLSGKFKKLNAAIQAKSVQ
jgi:flagellar basal-body rod protein FlgB